MTTAAKVVLDTGAYPHVRAGQAEVLERSAAVPREASVLDCAPLHRSGDRGRGDGGSLGHAVDETLAAGA